MKLRIPRVISVFYLFLISAGVLLILFFPSAGTQIGDVEESISIWGTSVLFDTTTQESTTLKYDSSTGYSRAITPLIIIASVFTVLTTSVIGPTFRSERISEQVQIMIIRIVRIIHTIGGICGFIALMLFVRFISIINTDSISYSYIGPFYIAAIGFGSSIILGILSSISEIELLEKPTKPTKDPSVLYNLTESSEEEPNRENFED